MSNRSLNQICTLCHTNIPGHRVLELTEDTELVVDHLVFCTTHADEPIKFFCKQCSISMCITCHVVTHKNHDTVTVQDALEELLPSVKADIKSIGKSLCAIQMNQEVIDKKKKALKTEYRQYKHLVVKTAEQRIEELQREKEKIISSMEEEEEKEVKIYMNK